MYKLFKLDNGLRVVTENIDYINSVSVGLWIENGSRNENRKNNGISHFIEHMLFKGTQNRTSKKIAQCIEEVGGQINAFTGKEATCFYTKTLDSHLSLSLDVLSDMLFNSKFSPEDIEKEKNVIIEEINMSEDLPEDVLIDLHSKAIWGDDTISLPILGTKDTIKSFTRDDLLSYLLSYYIPENSVISISGKFDKKNIKEIVNKYFGSWISGNKKITHYSNPNILNSNLFKEKDIEQIHVSLGIHGISMGDDKIYPLLLLNNILGGGSSSILFQKLREEKAICYSIYSYLSCFKNTGIIAIYAGLNQNYIYEAISLIKEILYNFSRIEITQEKLRKAKEQLKGNYILGLESTSSRMFSNGKSVLFLNRLNKPNDVLNKIDNITIDDLKDVSKITFSNNIANSAFVGQKLNLNLVDNILSKETKSFTCSKRLEI